MRITLLLIIVGCLQVSASVYGQKITLSETNVSLEKAFKEIKKQSGYTFFYENKLLKSTPKININIKDASLEETLEQCFKGLSLTYGLAGKTIVIKALPSGINASQKNSLINVKGKVIDEKGLPLPGATVKVKGGNWATVTDVEGRFTLNNVPDDAILIISFIGYTQQEISVTKSLDAIKLTLNNSDLNEVIVVGYGTQKKANITGAIASVSGVQLESRPLTNLASGLNGLVPGLNINLQNGQPGTPATFNIRGVTSLASTNDPTTTSSNSSPLILVDGVVRDANLIDPTDIESVSILKDAASSTIYGGRGAYGVILITTKQGKKGKPQLSYNGSYTITKAANLPNYINSLQYLELFNEAQRTGQRSGGGTADADMILTPKDSTMITAYFNDPANNPYVYQDPGTPSKYRYVGNTNWVKELYPGWAPQTQHNLSLSGGDDKTTYVANMGYLRQDGIQKTANQVYQRYTPSLRVNTDVNSWLSLNFSTALTTTKNDLPGTTGAGQGGSWMPGDLRPLMPVKHPDGNYSGQGNYTNPIAVQNLSGRQIEKVNDFWTTGRVTLKPINHFSVVSDFTYNTYADFTRDHRIPFTEYGYNSQALGLFPWTSTSRINEYRENNIYTAFNASATYENTFGTKHYVKALVGYNQEYKHYQTLSTTAINLIVPSIPSIGQNSDTKPEVTALETEYALMGQFFRVDYIFNRRYFLNVSGRYDGSSRFSADSRYKFSSAFSGGWDIAQEDFMGDLKNTISQLRLRASYGKLPNQSAGNYANSRQQYPYIPLLSTGQVNYLFNDQRPQGVYPPGLVSATYTWEYVAKKNLGVDFSILNDRLSGSFDYSISNTTNMLIGSQQLPVVLGTNPPIRNAGNLETKGWELSLSWRDKMFNDKLGYRVTAGLSDYTSKIKSYGNNPTRSLSDYYEGQTYGEIWGFVSDGFFKTDAEALAATPAYTAEMQGFTRLAGDVKYQDLDHNGKIGYGKSTVDDPGDKKIIGNKTPRYRFNFTLNLDYKNFDFTGFVQGVLKGDFDPNTSSNALFGFAGGQYSIPYVNALNRWTPSTPDAYLPRIRFGAWSNQETQTKYLQSFAYARVKQLTLGYSLKPDWLKAISIKRLRMYVTGENLFTITSLNKAYDPEAIQNGGGYNTYPYNKVVSFGLQATL